MGRVEEKRDEENGEVLGSRWFKRARYLVYNKFLRR